MLAGTCCTTPALQNIDEKSDVAGDHKRSTLNESTLVLQSASNYFCKVINLRAILMSPLKNICFQCFEK